MLLAPGSDQLALRSALICYGLEFAVTPLSSGAKLSPDSSLGMLIEQAQCAARQGSAADWERLARPLASLNGNDPQGRRH